VLPSRDGEDTGSCDAFGPDMRKLALSWDAGVQGSAPCGFWEENNMLQAFTTLAFTTRARRGVQMASFAARAAVFVGALVAGVHGASAQSFEAVFSKAGTPGKTVDHSAWDRMLKAYVKPDSSGLNRVAYTKFKADGHKDLKAYVAALQAVDVPTLSKDEQFAFWANLYNARTIDVVLDKYPVKSIKEVSLGGGLKSLVTGGPWQGKIVKVNGFDLSLDDIENNILRAIYKDPRVHYAVNCASVGCPNLLLEAFTGAKLEAQLEAGAKDFVNSPRGIKIDGDKVWASSIYDWFKADFGGNVASITAHMAKYAEPALKAKLAKVTAINDYGYDWALADAK
jgi:Protein of unknown function, DUF547